ncbi:DUF2225 domain-containing protein [Bacillus sp. REN10]|uniref:DUF2225 domain-containing protein n=1 Tax=Bacillus sp. REN10 TaxID=2782541 RepID=UPI00193BC706|nr:DUF2225 domain-containing protein [Bacillus sp. REN10]
MDHISPYYEKELKCPVCEQKFQTTKLRNRFVKVNGHDTDLMPMYDQDSCNPLFYHVFVCCHCGYSFSDEFSSYFAPGAKDKIIDQIKNQWVYQDYGKERTILEAINSYKLALYSGLLKKEKHLTLAGLALRTAWLYRELGHLKEEKRFMLMAANQYKEAYETEDLTGKQMSEVKVLYLIAELNRRADNNEVAVSYFSKVIEKQHMSSDKKIVDMARDRWYEIREEMKQQKEATA